MLPSSAFFNSISAAGSILAVVVAAGVSSVDVDDCSSEVCSVEGGGGGG